MVKNKYLLEVPAKLWREAKLRVGDSLKADVKKGKITLAAQSEIDRGIAQGLEDIRKGRVYGPFNTAEEMIASLKENIKKRRQERLVKSQTTK